MYKSVLASKKVPSTSRKSLKAKEGFQRVSCAHFLGQRSRLFQTRLAPVHLLFESCSKPGGKIVYAEQCKELNRWPFVVAPPPPPRSPSPPDSLTNWPPGRSTPALAPAPSASPSAWPGHSQVDSPTNLATATARCGSGPEKRGAFRRGANGGGFEAELAFENSPRCPEAFFRWQGSHVRNCTDHLHPLQSGSGFAQPLTIGSFRRQIRLESCAIAT